MHDVALGTTYHVTNQRKNNNNNTQRNKRTMNQSKPKPQYRMKSEGTMVITHTEYAGTVNPAVITVGALNDTNTRLSHVPLKLMINPGDGRTFPWLNGVASRFEKYKFTHLEIQYEPTCSTLESGGVALCPVYDPADPLPRDRHILYNTEGVVRGVVYDKLKLIVPKQRLRPNDTLFVRETHEGLMDENELRLSDLGYFAVSLSDTSAAINYGDIFLKYTVELTSPRVGRRSAKCGRYTLSNASNTPNTNVHPSAFGPVDPNDRTNHSAGDTLMYSVDFDENTYTNPNTTYHYDTNTVTFHEPFTGLMSYHYDQAGPSSNSLPWGLIINGQKDDGTDGHMVPVEGKKHKKPWAKTKFIKGIKNAYDGAMWLIDVAAEAGDSLEMAWDAISGETPMEVIMTLNDVAPEVIELAGLV